MFFLNSIRKPANVLNVFIIINTSENFSPVMVNMVLISELHVNNLLNNINFNIYIYQVVRK